MIKLHATSADVVALIGSPPMAKPILLDPAGTPKRAVAGSLARDAQGGITVSLDGQAAEERKIRNVIEISIADAVMCADELGKFETAGRIRIEMTAADAAELDAAIEARKGAAAA